jgi:hypothetical protein
MNPLALMLTPVPLGWAVTLTDGRELARFLGPGARRRALGFIEGPDVPTAVARAH